MIRFIIISLVGLSVLAQNSDAKYRKLFFEASDSFSKLKTLISELDKAPTTDKVANYYRAASWTMLAEHVGSPIKKFKYFKKGTIMLEQSISAFKQDIEPRFLRLTIQSNAPSFLGYNYNLVSDKNFIINNLPKAKSEKADNFFISNVVSYLETLDFCTESDKKILKSI